MSDPHVLNVFTLRGRIGRARYLSSVLILLALNHNIGRLLGALAGNPWPYIPWLVFVPNGTPVKNSAGFLFYNVMWLVTLPFIWAGVTLTRRRLRDAELPLWLALLFFVPFINVIFLFVLAAIPTRQSADEELGLPSRVGRFIPESKFGSAVFGIGFTALIAAVEVLFSANGLGNYGWGLFVGVPFFLGLNSSLICGFHRRRSLATCLAVAVLSTVLVGLGLFAIAVEGIICLAMALPLALVIALFGGFIGFLIQDCGHYPATNLRVVSVGILLIPGLILFEHAVGPTPPVYEVKTSIVIKNDPETVWKHVVSFSQLPPPTEAMFKTGLAYPIRAEMHGQGAGAERHCVFSTGAFVEPITVWDEPRLLAFEVKSQPPAMKELSIYSNVHPPHLDDYFIAKRGQFELKPLPDGTTLLEGTTWYQNRYWPAPYWHLWSDYVMDGIHNRVLLHIKSLAEQDSQRAPN
ncbi:MAG TPA: DUF805 domain-containing protein [Pyrinomonadaceae bacterium]|nr:DUF805 domain-containing protein [Pyrinomonadaceae bacterium]